MWANLNKLLPKHHFSGIPRRIAEQIGEEVKLMDPEDGFPADRRRSVCALVKMDMKKTLPRKVKRTIAGQETIVGLWFDKMPRRICSRRRKSIIQQQDVEICTLFLRN